jgi:hypothetical protein
MNKCLNKNFNSDQQIKNRAKQNILSSLRPLLVFLIEPVAFRVLCALTGAEIDRRSLWLTGVDVISGCWLTVAKGTR